MNLFLDISYDEIFNTNLFDAMYECSERINDIISAMYITDTVLETTMLLEDDSEKQAEDTIKKSKINIIESFKKLLAKIKEWFKEVFVKLRVKFNYANAFYKKYKKEIDDVKYDAKILPPNTTEFNNFNGEGTKLLAAFNKVIMDGIAKVIASTNDEKMTKNDIFDKLKSTININDNVENMSDFKRIANERYLYHPTKINELMLKKGFMLNFDPVTCVVNYNTDLNFVQSLFKGTSKAINDTINSIEKPIMLLRFLKRVKLIIAPFLYLINFQHGQWHLY